VASAVTTHQGRHVGDVGAARVTPRSRHLPHLVAELGRPPLGKPVEVAVVGTHGVYVDRRGNWAEGVCCGQQLASFG
jgi:hypothetical protein